MKKFMLFLIPAVLFAQVEIDTVIYFPSCTLYLSIFIPELNKLYIQSPYRLLVLDCSTYTLKAEIPTPWDRGGAYFLWNQHWHKLYYSHWTFDSISIIDVIADTLYKWIPRHSFSYPAYVKNTDRIYYPWSNLFVIDCATDSVIKEIPPPVPGYRFFVATWDSAYNRLYVSLGRFQNPGLIAVYDLNNDSLLKVIDPHEADPGRIKFNYYYGKGYYTYGGPPLGNWRAGVIDIKNLSFIKRFPIYVAYGALEPIALSTKSNKTYISGGDTLAQNEYIYVIDNATDSIIKQVWYRQWSTYVRWASWSNRIYFAKWDTLLVLDCETDSIIARLYFPFGPGSAPLDLQFDPIRQRVFGISNTPYYNWDAVYVLRDVVPGVEEKKVEISGNLFLPTVVRNVLKWEPRKDRGPKTEDRLDVFLVDVTGRKVLELMPGSNDVRFLAPGVYFIQTGSGIGQKVVIAR